MGRTASVCFQLLVCFGCERSIALHNPGRDFFISVPGSVLDNNAAFGSFRFFCCQAHAVIIIHIFNSNRGIFLCDILKACLCGALWHAYHAFLAKLICSPCHAASVVAVSCSKKCGLAEGFTQLFGCQEGIIYVTDVTAGFFCDISGNCIRTAQHLKGIQPEPAGFVLDIQAV